MGVAVFNPVTAKARLATQVGAVPLLAPHMKLFSNNISPTPHSVLGDFTECAFGGYALQAVTWGTPVYDQGGNPVAPSGAVVFTCDGSSSGMAYGWYLIDSTGALVCSGRLDGAPLNFASNGDAAILYMLFAMQSGSVTVAQGP